MPTGPGLFCEEFEQAPACESAFLQCTYCHTAAPRLNPFGADVKAALARTPGYDVSEYTSYLPGALRAVTDLDSDGDGVSNLEEILAGTSPAVADTPGSDAPALGQWDPAVAFRRVHVQFCGSSPTYEQTRAFAQEQDKRQAVHLALTQCLTSTYWKNEALHRLADEKIKPLSVVGLDGNIALADYGWDYRLFSYALTDDRDARDLLLADYHITEDGEVTRDVIRRQNRLQFDSERISIGTGQPLPPERRAGMITTQWFIVMNTMFSRLPRTTAAQAYRAYLGLDIAASQGLYPVEGEPRDVDNKGVAQPACAVCHSTLDPLAYAFSTYKGIEVEVGLLFRNVLGSYDANREPWEADGFLFGEPVADVIDWATKAAQTDAFKQNLAHMFFEYALGRGPDQAEASDFEALWRALPEDSYSANQLIHRVVNLNAFGSM